MAKWNVEKTFLFEQNFGKLVPNNLKSDFQNQMKKICENPYNSKPLGNKFFREKKIQKWRIYFLIYERKLVIYFIDFGDKKMQKKSILFMKESFKVFKEQIDKKYTT